MQLKNKASVAILLSTFNGEKFLPDLIDSILNQSYQNFTLYIRDDCSRDNTPLIIEKYAANCKKVVVIANNGENVGSKMSFIYMLQSVDSDYYMFCDQDDIWLPFKIEHSLNFCKKKEHHYSNQTPILVHTDLQPVDGNLNMLSESYWKDRGWNTQIPHTIKYLCHYNDIVGCTVLFNKATIAKSIHLFNIELPKYAYHDWVLALNVAASGGVIAALDEQTILYRRHGDNETDGFEPRPTLTQRIIGVGNTYNRLKERYKFVHHFCYSCFTEYILYKFILYFKRLWLTKRV